MDEAISDTQLTLEKPLNVTADNSRPMAYLILKVIGK
jgi:hypothetical protein